MATRESESQRIAKLIARGVGRGTWKAGEKLPRLAELAQQVGGGRDATRNGLILANGARVVDYFHGGRRATTLPETEWSAWDDVGQEAFAASSLDLPLIAGTHRLLLLALPLAAEQAALNAEPDDLATIHQAVEKFEHIARGRRAAVSHTHPPYEKAQVDLLRAIVRASGDVAMRSLLDPPLRIVARESARRDHLPADVEDDIRESRAIVAAIAAHDPARARRTMTDHLDSVAARMTNRPRRTS